MQYKILATLFLATTALAAPADPTATSSSTETADSDDTYNIGDVPSSIMNVLATAIPASWYDEIIDPASRSSIASQVAAGTYPAWYNALPSSVKAWATANLDDQIGGATATPDSSATRIETADSGAVETGSSAAAIQTSNAAETSSNAAKTTLASTTSSGPNSDSSSSSTSSSPSSSKSTGGAPAPTGSIAMSVAGAAGVLALALAL
ncbi:hypothetical protein PITC_027340 [Penicillium italicum]|uniref:Uncharacterized protein n=1 Tax=Penicillium italicum TaxID=40296 RepID=A0A0A2KXV0_PENIT|nr:hypothetical protein PITC_027340 [Penicillium italicum]